MDVEDYIGKTILIGLTHCEANGTVLGQEQMFGTITEFSESGIGVKQDDGSMYYLPPDVNALHFAKKGEYRLRATGKIVKDPDYICTYTVTKPQKH